MDFNLNNSVLFLAILSTALVAGLFYGWVVSVIPATLNFSDHRYLLTMQEINREILNPSFFLAFVGSIILLPLATFFQYKTGVSSKFWWTFGATLVYMIGTIGVTMFGNVPMNDALEAIDLSTLNVEEMNTVRLDYEGRWNQFNRVRTVCSVLAFVLLLLGHLSGE